MSAVWRRTAELTLRGIPFADAHRQARLELEPTYGSPLRHLELAHRAERIRLNRGRAGRAGLTIARSHRRDDLPYRAVIREVAVEIQPIPRGPKVSVQRLELECGHLVPLPGGALIDWNEPGQVRQCLPCAEAR